MVTVTLEHLYVITEILVQNSARIRQLPLLCALSQGIPLNACINILYLKGVEILSPKLGTCSLLTLALYGEKKNQGLCKLYNIKYPVKY